VLILSIFWEKIKVKHRNLSDLIEQLFFNILILFIFTDKPERPQPFRFTSPANLGRENADQTMTSSNRALMMLPCTMPLYSSGDASGVKDASAVPFYFTAQGTDIGSFPSHIRTVSVSGFGIFFHKTWTISPCLHKNANYYSKRFLK
jgi:hypothetical protein